ncbi:MAG: UDP-N-acetylglucosamine 2-epimerase (non-hydrolyzing) [Euryarchaeota archaeon]|nr:UDP-N-acetylglucosamine 2-epimerase (non-hydrolyzing) [Euryarchaeota archaeon]
MKIAIIIGTRPEIIKMAPVLDEIEKRGIDYILIHTGQHYDHEMSDQFFLDLELKTPDFNIGVGSGSHGEQTALMMKGIENVLMSEKPDLVMVQGDTNAVMAGAIVGGKLHIPVGHVEAGLRSYDKTMPEEINRVVADACSKIYFVPTEESAINLIFEGITPHDIFITGNTVVDACIRNLKIAKKQSNIASNLDPEKELLTLTMHRPENVDNTQRLQNIVDALLEFKNLDIIFPVHPRTVKNLKNFSLYQKLKEKSHIKLIKPIGYLDFLLLLSNSKLVMTDSGGIQEEAITLNVPCITLRYNTERPETVKAGGNILVGADKEKIINSVNEILSNHNLYNRMQNALNPYGNGKASERIIDAILNAHDKNELNIKMPENIKGNVVHSLIKINTDINVSEYENRENAIVKIVYEGDLARFPYPQLNLKNKFIILDKFQ